MLINSDLKQRAVIRPDDYHWVDSPMPGVQRMMLDRIGDEVARATSLVRYAPNSRFSPHTHDGGEEFLVLEGTFGDEHQLYPAGTYVRNPIGTRHTPHVGEDGCLIFVKLQQFAADDDRQLAVDTGAAEWQPTGLDGLRIMHLHKHESEKVALLDWSANTPVPEHVHRGGEEVFVVQGSFSDEHGEYPAGTWLRNPDQSSHIAVAGNAGAIVLIKTGHLPIV